MQATTIFRAMRTGLVMAAVAAAPAFAEVPASAAEIRLSFAPVVRQAAPAVVNIYATRLVRQRSPFAGDPFFENFFRGFNRPDTRMQNSLGSGVIVDPGGIAVSNYHVVGDATDIRVVLSDRREFDGKVILADKDADLAFIRLVGASGLPALALADSDAAEVGDLVLAIGNPFGVGQTVTSGIVSALARGGGRGRAGYLVQTDAAINPGNSGGALVDMNGRLLGINTSILTRSGGSNGIGFSIPANLVAAYLRQARDGNDSAAMPWTGLKVQPVDADMAEALGQDLPAGVMVVGVHPDSGFAAAGVRPGDVILAVDGAPVFSREDIEFRLFLAPGGAPADVTILRKGRERTLSVELAAAPPDAAPDVRTIKGNTPFAGLSVAGLTPRLADDYGLAWDATGVVVTGVEGPSRRLGLEPGDILREVNGRAVTDTATLARLAARRGHSWTLRVRRGNREIMMRLIN